VTDLADFKAFFDRYKIEFKESGLDEDPPAHYEGAASKLSIPKDRSGFENLGYTDFYAAFFFDKDGKYLNFGVWE
jgi:hypothetical protein